MNTNMNGIGIQVFLPLALAVAALSLVARVNISKSTTKTAVEEKSSGSLETAAGAPRKDLATKAVVEQKQKPLYDEKKTCTTSDGKENGGDTDNTTKTTSAPETKSSMTMMATMTARDDKIDVANTDKTKTSHSEDLAVIQKDFYLPPSPDVIPLAAGQRLVVIGDIHGRYDQLKTCLVESRIIDNASESPKTDWIAGNTILVQLGDLLDRGYEEENCLRILCKLGRQAQKVGGAVIVLWGNHEVLNAEHNYFCVGDKRAFEDVFGGYLDRRAAAFGNEDWRLQYPELPARSAAFRPNGILAQPFLSKLKISVKVGRTLLVHGGLTVEMLKLCGGSIEAMNESTKKYILSDGLVDDHFFYAHWWSPLTMRDYSQGKMLSNKTEIMVNDILRELEVDRIVVGHTIQTDGVNSVLDGKVWRVDVGCGYKKIKGIALEVTQDGATVVSRKGVPMIS